ncbi:MAG: hypothetical protein MJ193_02725, partial [Clostridia bacterium]|nr:hypothetical protein [Clostridia bacterium]
MNKIVKIVLISLAVLFFIPIIYTIVTYANDNKKIKLLETGTETTANVIDYKYVMTVNDVDYYSFKYEYCEKNGIAHTGYTESSFEFYYVINV